MEPRRALDRLTGPWGTLAVLAAGLAVGVLAPDVGAPFAAGFRLFVKGLIAAAPVVILLSITPALLGLIGVGAGRLTGVVLLLFLGFTVLAGVLALAVVGPVLGLPFGATETGEDPFEAMVSVVQGLGASPPLYAVVYSVVVAVALRLMVLAGGAVAYVARATIGVFAWIGADGMAAVGRVFTRVMPLLLFAVGTYVPEGAADAAAEAGRAIGEGGASGFDPLRWYLVAAALTAFLAVTWLALAALVACRVSRVPLRRILRSYVAPTFAFAWASASSTATIPVNLAAAKAIGVRREVRDLVIPLGATVNLDGAMLGSMVLTPIAARAVGIDVGIGDLIATLPPLVILTIGAPGLPAGVGIIAPPVIATVLGLTGDVATAFIGVWFAFNLGLTDQFRTAASSCTNGLIAMIAQVVAHPGRSVILGHVVLEEVDEDGEPAAPTEGKGAAA